MTGDQYKVGDKVILGKHELVNGDDNWSLIMDQYVGRVAVITSLVLSSSSHLDDGSGSQLYYVSVDGVPTTYHWRGINMKPVDSKTITRSTSGCKCTKCQEYYPYAEATTNFVCWGCKH